MSAAAVLSFPTRREGMSLDDLESELLGLAGHIAGAECQFLQLLAEFDQGPRSPPAPPHCGTPR